MLILQLVQGAYCAFCHMAHREPIGKLDKRQDPWNLRDAAYVERDSKMHDHTLLLDIAWYCLILLDIAWYCLILLDIAWYCLILLDIAWFYPHVSFNLGSSQPSGIVFLWEGNSGCQFQCGQMRSTDMKQDSSNNTSNFKQSKIDFASLWTKDNTFSHFFLLFMIFCHWIPAKNNTSIKLE